MPSGFDSLKNIIDTVVFVIGACAIVGAVLTYRVTRNQFTFSVMISCIERFQNIVVNLSADNATQKQQAVKRYIDLCNEELFYFKNNYLPDEVVHEWLDGMLYYLPWFDATGKNANEHCLPEILEGNLLDNYPRIQQAFTVTRKYNLETLSERNALIDHVRRNLKKSTLSNRA